MTVHISARVAWHMDGWSGRICRDPASNVYCVGNDSYPGPLIREKRDLDWDEEAEGGPAASAGAAVWRNESTAATAASADLGREPSTGRASAATASATAADLQEEGRSAAAAALREDRDLLAAVTLGVVTIAAASAVAAAAFAGYATGSVARVGEAVDDVLKRSERPPPKTWKRVERRRAADSGVRSGFRARVADAGGRAAAEPARGSRFERVRRQRLAAEAARDTKLRERLAESAESAAGDQTSEAFRERIEAAGETTREPKVDEFRSRVDRPKAKREKKSSKRPFEKRIKAGGK